MYKFTGGVVMYHVEVGGTVRYFVTYKRAMEYVVTRMFFSSTFRQPKEIHVEKYPMYYIALNVKKVRNRAMTSFPKNLKL